MILDQSKEPIVSQIRDTLKRLGWRFSETRDKRCQSIRFVMSCQLDRASRWREWFGSLSFNKRLPIDLLRQMKNLLDLQMKKEKSKKNLPN